MSNIPSIYLILIPVFLSLNGCTEENSVPSAPDTNAKGQSVYQDVPYIQDYSVRYYLPEQQNTLKLTDLSINRDGQIQILSDNGLLVPDNGSLFYSGKLVPDISYPPMIPKKIKAICTYRNQTVYLDSQYVFSNAWAGKIQTAHGLPGASLFAAGRDFDFLISDGELLVYFDKDGKKLWSGSLKGIRQIVYQQTKNSFLLISSGQVAEFIPGLFARSFERDYKTENTKEEGWERKELLSGSPATLWLPASDHHNWTWRSTASSDQTVGQIFALTMILELADNKEWKARALKCLDDLMGSIVKNDLYIIDVDGEPTLWGKWNPDYVNKFPVNVGDRRLNSSNIIAFLQTAYKFTGKEIYENRV